MHLSFNGASRWVPASTFAPGSTGGFGVGPSNDVAEFNEAVTNADGSTETRRVSGTSLQRLLALEGVRKEAVTGITVTRISLPAGVTDQYAVIKPEDFLNGYPAPSSAGCPGNRCPATISVGYSGGAGAQFFRPPSYPGEQNYLDQISTDTGGGPGSYLQVNVSTSAAPLKVSAVASDATPEPGQAITFRATIPASPSGMTVTWTFDDGSAADVDDAAGSNWAVSHAFAAGTYNVELTAIDGNGGVGSATVPIQVGPKTGAGAATTPVASTSGGAGAGSGGDGSGGGAQASGGGSGGSSSGSTGSTKGKTTKSGGGTKVPRSGDERTGASSNSTRVGSGTSGGSASTTTTPAPALPGSTPTTATSPTGTTTTGTATTPAGSSPATGAAGTGTRNDPGKQGAAADPRLVPITGLEVAGQGRRLSAAIIAAEALASATPVEHAAARAAAGHSGALLGGLTGAVVIIALLGVGAAREWRRLPGRPSVSA